MKNLEEEEKDRNRKKLSLMYFHGSCPLAASVHEMAHKHHGKTDEQKFKTKQPMDPEDSNVWPVLLCNPAEQTDNFLNLDSFACEYIGTMLYLCLIPYNTRIEHTWHIWQILLGGLKVSQRRMAEKGHFNARLKFRFLCCLCNTLSVVHMRFTPYNVFLKEAHEDSSCRK